MRLYGVLRLFSGHPSSVSSPQGAASSRCSTHMVSYSPPPLPSLGSAVLQGATSVQLRHRTTYGFVAFSYNMLLVLNGSPYLIDVATTRAVPFYRVLLRCFSSHLCFLAHHGSQRRGSMHTFGSCHRRGSAVLQGGTLVQLRHSASWRVATVSYNVLLVPRGVVRLRCISTDRPRNGAADC